jgi:hypothetical protein
MGKLYEEWTLKNVKESICGKEYTEDNHENCSPEIESGTAGTQNRSANDCP